MADYLNEKYLREINDSKRVITSLEQKISKVEEERDSLQLATVLSRNNLTLRLRCGCGSDAVRLRFGCGSVAVRLRCGCGSVAVRLRFGCGSFAVRLRFGCGRPIKTANDRRNEIAVSLRCSPVVFDRIPNMVMGAY